MDKIKILENVIGHGKGETDKYEEQLDIDETELWNNIAEIINIFNHDLAGAAEYRYLGHFINQHTIREPRNDGIYLFDWILNIVVEKEK